MAAFHVADDHSRVVLEEDPDEPDSDYINANFIDVSVSFYKCARIVESRRKRSIKITQGVG